MANFDEIPLWEILLLEQSWAKALLEGQNF
jgi:hypothetical protein